MSDDLPSVPRLRASDADRNATLEQLTQHASEGRLTLAEHEERAGRALQATYTSELDELLADLPGAAGQTVARPSEPAWIVSAIGDTKRTGRWRVGHEVNVIGGLGDREFDLREAQLDGPEAVINVYNLLGDVKIFVPDSIDVTVNGGNLLGDHREYGEARPPHPGAPRVTVRVFGLIGDLGVYRVTREDREVPMKRLARTVRRRANG